LPNRRRLRKNPEHHRRRGLELDGLLRVQEAVVARRAKMTRHDAPTADDHGAAGAARLCAVLVPAR
jgi:hypothetical protein